MRQRCLFLGVGLVFGLALPSVTHAQITLDEALESATKAATAKVAPSLVQIRTIGGLGTVGAPKGDAPTTGVVVSADGYIVSSLFNFADKPAAITVSLPTLKDPLAARIVATDHARMLVLLKIEAKDLPVPAAAPKKEFRIGQWAIALGKSWSEGGSGAPSVSIGILSATDRIWGKAIQTDAKVSPINYGGALVDIQGRVMGVLVPLSPRGTDELAGVDWYDSGIAFAVPLEDINRVLPRMKEGKDLKAGTLGVNLTSADPFAAATIKDVTPNSPAAQAGIQPGDQIIAVDGKTIAMFNQLKHALGGKYAGDTVTVKVKRGTDEKEFPNITLGVGDTGYVVPFLGILPMRDDPDAGVEVRYVFAKGPAETAGIKVGDRITKVQTATINAGRDQLFGILNGLVPGSEIKVEVKRKDGGKTETLTVKLGTMPEGAPPGELPLGTHKKALAKRPAPPGPRPMPPMPAPMPPPMEEKKDPPKTGTFVKRDETSGRSYWMHVPEDYDPNISYALMVWLHPAGNPMAAPVQQAWKDLCKKHHIIVLAPNADNPTGWLTSEADAVKNDLREVLGQYTIDRQRVLTHGLGNGGDMALYVAFDTRDLIRAAASVGGVLQISPKDPAAGQRLSFYLVAGTRDPALENIRATRKKLEEKKYPVTFKEIPNLGTAYLEGAEAFAELARWIDSLDRL